MSEQSLPDHPGSARFVPVPSTEPVDAAWREPLRLVERALRALPPAVGDDLFALDDFVIIGRIESAAHPPVVLYKHLHLWTYCNLDPAGRPYRFVAPRRFGSFGTYRPYDSLREAVDDLGLADLDRLVRGRARRPSAPPGTSAA